MLPELNETPLAQWATTIATAVLGTILGLQQLRKRVVKDEADITNVQASEKVVKLMREEVTRLQEQNGLQQQQLTRLQDQNSLLHKQLGELCSLLDEQQREFKRQMNEQQREFKQQIGLLQAELTLLRNGRGF